MRLFFYCIILSVLFLTACTSPEIKSQQLLKKAQIKYNQGDIKNAIRLLKISIESDYHNTDALTNLARIVLEKNNHTLQKSQPIDTAELINVLHMFRHVNSDTIIAIKDSVFDFTINQLSSGLVDSTALSALFDIYAINFNKYFGKMKDAQVIFEFINSAPKLNLRTKEVITCFIGLINNFLELNFNGDLFQGKRQEECAVLQSIINMTALHSMEKVQFDSFNDVFNHYIKVKSKLNKTSRTTSAIMGTDIDLVQRFENEIETVFLNGILESKYEILIDTYFDTLLPFKFSLPENWDDFTSVVTATDTNTIPQGLRTYNKFYRIKKLFAEKSAVNKDSPPTVSVVCSYGKLTTDQESLVGYLEQQDNKFEDMNVEYTVLEKGIVQFKGQPAWRIKTWVKSYNAIEVDYILGGDLVTFFVKASFSKKDFPRYEYFVKDIITLLHDSET